MRAKYEASKVHRVGHLIELPGITVSAIFGGMSKSRKIGRLRRYLYMAATRKCRYLQRPQMRLHPADPIPENALIGETRRKYGLDSRRRKWHPRSPSAREITFLATRWRTLTISVSLKYLLCLGRKSAPIGFQIDTRVVRYAMCNVIDTWATRQRPPP